MPETRYLRRKISREVSKSAEGSSGVPYALRSRSIRTQSQGEMNELDQFSLQASKGVEQPVGNPKELSALPNIPHTHSYDLRSRARTQTS
jgi:hypothetical protein